MRPPVRCALIDLGNVLVKIDLSRLGKRFEALTGKTPDQLRVVFAADDLVHRYESGQISSREFHREVCDRFGRDIPWDRFANAWNSIFLPEPILEDHLLAGMASRMDLWIISNTNPLHFEYIREHYGFFRHFKGFILSYEAGAMKPDPAIFARAVELTGFSRGETLFVDDQESNVKAACSLGFQAFRFVGKAHLLEQLCI